MTEKKDSQSQEEEDSRFIVTDKRHWALEEDEETGELPEPEERLPTYVEQLKKEAKEKDQRLKEYIQAYKAKTAETDEFRQRLQRENETRLDQIKANLFQKLVPVLDNFNRAVEAAKTSGDLESFKQGVEIIFGQMKHELEAEGVTALNPKGQAFDPNLHEVCMTQETEDPALDNQVLEVLEPGYVFKEKLIKPAKVKVAQLKTTS